jgi:hypothetical protein
MTYLSAWWIVPNLRNSHHSPTGLYRQKRSVLMLGFMQEIYFKHDDTYQQKAADL